MPRIPHVPTLALAGLLAGFCAAASAAAGASALGPALGPALQAAQRDAAAPFALEVDCTSEAGHRSARLYPSGVLIWNGERQARVGAAERQAVIDALLEADFASFADSYGGKPKAGVTAAPVMVLCRIEATAGEVTKASYQDANGERSQRFMALADRLLDVLAGPGAAGVGADSLADGLDKLAAGELAVEALGLHLMRLPGGRRGAGLIIELSAGDVASRAYEPGVEVGEAAPRPLSREEVESLLAALEAAAMTELPTRTTAPDIYQLRVQVLQHRRSVHARPPGDGEPSDPAGERLAQLAAALAALFPVP